jgi:poly-gamma-glutamate capsule biosynthesis protein CapA/YwtB (metallophosphatase superfamily)
LNATLVTALAAASAVAADGPWPWSGSFPSDAVQVLLVGDINVQKRADPAEVFMYVRETLNRADLVYGNLEGLLVKSEGPDKDIPDKSGWQHIGPEALQALKAGNVSVVGVANNVAYGHENILKTLALLDENHIVHTGGGANLEKAHAPAIVERKGVKFGFLQYTAKWYLEDHQIATATSPGVARILSRHGSHVLQGVEVYRDKPILYCVGNFAMDWIRMRPNREGMAIRLVVTGKKISRVSFVPLTRDADNKVVMLEPASGEGERLVGKVKGLSRGVPLEVDGHEVVLLEHGRLSASN